MSRSRSDLKYFNLYNFFCNQSGEEVNEVLGLVRDVGAEVAADDALPGWTEKEV
ncbi:unnamed protein product [Oikopleura dioica]|uniref:Uncharacterized protein n=1 Tax=Oikopleura dioica TaxID=34765 RepID=E4X4S9_OIKDI|nr:unnamed protein product [Oikopleura dioica]